ncbi:MAG: DUF4785 family protein, partial [Psychrosphaera sp.]|nr:DUF4785 family protein [Psychrosphaera sp.]
MKTFSKKTVTLVVATALGLLVSSASIAATSGKIAQPAPKKAQAIDTNIINFSFDIALDHQLDLNTQAAISVSDEYYFTVSGSQLNNGVDIHTSQKCALIKISRQNDQGKALESKAMQLRSDSQPQKNLATNIIGENDLQTSGIFTASTAIKLTDEVQPGKLTLSYDLPLAAKSLYVIHVKEKNSVNKLEISTAKQNYLQGESFTFNAVMLAKGDTLVADTVDAYIVSPSGKKYNASVSHTNSGVVQISASKQALETAAIEAPINGLYELHVNAIATNKGQKIHRTGKIAFALSPDTADLNKLSLVFVNKNKPSANIGLTVKTAGRFEVRGILYGYDAQGNLKPMMETHSAQNFSAGKQTINMQFDQKILAKSTLKAPYVLKNVR